MTSAAFVFGPAFISIQEVYRRTVCDVTAKTGICIVQKDAGSAERRKIPEDFCRGFRNLFAILSGRQDDLQNTDSQSMICLDEADY